MDFTRFKEKVAALYRGRDPATRLDQAERLVAKAQAFAATMSRSGTDVDLDMVEALAWLILLRNTVLPQMATRTTLEACLVEQGWSTARARELFRSLERLPDHPQSIEEQLAADAETVSRLGLLGLLRQVAISAAGGAGLLDSLELAFKQLGRRIYTVPATAEATLLKDELRDLILMARRRLEEGEPQG
jgi:hypothetical protein